MRTRIIQLDPDDVAGHDPQNGAGIRHAVRLSAVSKVYGSGERRVVALRELSLSLSVGSYTAVMGPSGSGKSTFLHCAAGLDRPTSGQVFISELEVGSLTEEALSKLRRDRIGFIFQSFNLIPSLTAAENITLPLRLAKLRPNAAWLDEVADRVGLTHRMSHRPGELSGGQQQRVAIARALITQPDVIFADEPTGALDTRTGRDVLALMRQAVAELGQTVVMVTHDPTAAACADTVVFLADGRVVDVMADTTPENVADRMTHLEA